MKIVYFIDHLRADGTQRALEQITDGLQRRGHRQMVLCLDDSVNHALVERLCARSVAVRIVGKDKWLTGSGFLETYKFLRAAKFDVAVTLLYVADLIGRPLARAARIPRLVSSLRARNVHYSFLKRALTRLSMPLADVVVLNSESVRAFAIAGEGVNPRKIAVIPNGVAVENYLMPITRDELRAQWNLPQKALVLGSIGRLAPQKGFDLLLRALAQVSTPNVHLVLIGKGEQEGALRALAAELRVPERVHFAGYRYDVPRLLGAFDLYVHPARFEGMPNAVMEAMAAGCPIVATAVDGTNELIEDGIHGWLVPPEDVGALTSAINKALRDPIQAQQRGKRAQQRAAAHFSERAMVESWEQVLRG